MKILVKFPTRSRPEKFSETIGRAISYESGLHDVRYLVAIDHDDDSMNSVLANFNDEKVRFQAGDHKTKVEAVNSFLPGDWDWDILVLLSDDMIAQRMAWDDFICAKMVEFYPALDGALWFDDDMVHDKLCTLPVMGRKYYERFNYVYEPGYKSLWCDNEYTDVGRYLGRLAYIPEVIFRHEHPVYMGQSKDALLERNDAKELWAVDHQRYDGRKVQRFGLRILDIMICTIPSRDRMFQNIYKALCDQVTAANLEGIVGVVYDLDDSELTIGAKRNRLMDNSTAEYICYVDDDDNVSPDYVVQIMSAIGECDVDCVGIIGSIRTGSERANNWRRFVHSIKYNRFYQLPDNTYVRPPNHLNPIRRSIASRFPFKDISHGEDTDYALRICRAHALHTERMTQDKATYFYIPSFWAAKRFGRTDGHAAVNLRDTASWPILEQDIRADNLPPIDESTGMEPPSTVQRSTNPIVDNPQEPERAIPPSISTSKWRSEGSRRKKKKNLGRR